MEIRAKLPQGQGTWLAIWMLPTDHIHGTWAASGEIDIMEAVNLGTLSDAQFDPAVSQSRHTLETRVHVTLHYGGTWAENTNEKGIDTSDYPKVICWSRLSCRV